MLINCQPDHLGKIRSVYVEIFPLSVIGDVKVISAHSFVDIDKDGKVVGIELTSEVSKATIEKAFKDFVTQSDNKKFAYGVRRTVTQILKGK